MPRDVLVDSFREVFGAEPKVIATAPGRINLIGEHTDYNEGFVFPMAIEPEVRIAVRARDDERVRLASSVYPGQIVEFSLQKHIDRGEPAWANYSRGVAAVRCATTRTCGSSPATARS